MSFLVQGIYDHTPPSRKVMFNGLYSIIISPYLQTRFFSLGCSLLQTHISGNYTFIMDQYIYCIIWLSRTCYIFLVLWSTLKSVQQYFFILVIAERFIISRYFFNSRASQRVGLITRENVHKQTLPPIKWVIETFFLLSTIPHPLLC